MQDTFGKGGGHMFVVFIWCGSGGSVIESSNLDDHDDSFLTSSVSHVYQSFCTITLRRLPFNHTYMHTLEVIKTSRSQPVGMSSMFLASWDKIHRYAHGISRIFPTEANTPQIYSTSFSKIIQTPCEKW